jgi:putative hydrolase of HD superfamily
MESRMDKLISFLKEIDKFKIIERKIWCTGLNHVESDAEHAWHVAMFLFLFEKDLPKGLDFARMLKLALMHDLVEIYAGDTFAYDKENRKSKKEREAKSAEKLFSQLPEDLQSEFKALLEEYEEKTTKESQFVHSFDKIQPILQNLITDGKTWKTYNIKYKDIDDYKRKMMLHNDIVLVVYEKLLAEAKARGILD